MSTIITREDRPWGTYEVLSVFKEEGVEGQIDVVIKRIVVNPGQRLSLQSHYGRDEHWQFVSGRGEAVVGEKTIKIDGPLHVFVPKQTQHRVTNKDLEAPLILIEVSLGMFDEKDIIRHEDDYGRK